MPTNIVTRRLRESQTPPKMTHTVYKDGAYVALCPNPFMAELIAACLKSALDDDD